MGLPGLDSGSGMGCMQFCSKDIDYFNPGEGQNVEVCDKDQVYQNIFSFTNYLRVKATTMDPALIYQNLDTCLLGKADKWYTEELSYIQHVGIQMNTNGVKKWYKALEQHFRDLPEKSLVVLKTCYYIIQDTQQNQDVLEYIQSIILNDKNSSTTISNYTQVLLVYEHIDGSLYQDFPIPTKNTTMADFIQIFYKKSHVWFNIYKYQGQTQTQEGKSNKHDQRGTFNQFPLT
ncbi:hypothetical protein L228DRAFT_269959 [Xylona heveae TC161]|uniref:Uncharacterized protein n=1 Tax=Xylona heveae (strain CBS 132557 / TC161) TaxID=1328760 RepID=A0A165F774_XYLHT|nr:hypothetical protein L228DRAFT_269959 [Xylona heveae TC161]KZF20662.1 hypothetical protein L228DRAFT_269959 [Xylona heveae TC161]